MKCSGRRYFEPTQVNTGDDTAEKSLDQVLTAATICRQHLANNIPMKWLTQEQWREDNNTTNCLICTKPFKSAYKEVRNHAYLTGEYRGPVHNTCNLNYHTHDFLFNIRNYFLKVRNIQRREAKLSINLRRVKNFDIKQKMAWKR